MTFEQNARVMTNDQLETSARLARENIARLQRQKRNRPFPSLLDFAENVSVKASDGIPPPVGLFKKEAS